MKKERWEATKILNKKIYKTIYPVFKSQFGFNQYIVDEFFDLLKERFEKGESFRPYYTKAMHDYIKACMIDEGMSVERIEQERMQQFLTLELPFITETIIVIQYLDNHILDEKFGIGGKNNLKLKKTLLKSKTLEGYLFKYLNHITNFDIDVKEDGYKKIECDVKKISRKHIRRILEYVNIGQNIELEWNRYSILKYKIKPKFSPFGVLDKKREELTKEEFKRLSNEAKEDIGFIDFEPMKEVIDFMYQQFQEPYHTYLELYLKRVYLTTGSFYILIAELLTDLMQYDGKEKDNIISFAKCFGVMRQIVNDNTDIVPEYYNVTTNAKIVTDAFSDLRNGGVTLPTLLHISIGDKCEITNFLSTNHINLNNEDSNKKQLSLKQQKIFFNELIQSKAIYQSISIGRLLAFQAKSYHAKENSFKGNLFKMLEIAHHNKFYHKINNRKINKMYEVDSLFRVQYKRLKQELKYTHKSIEFI